MRRTHALLGAVVLTVVCLGACSSGGGTAVRATSTASPTATDRATDFRLLPSLSEGATVAGREVSLTGYLHVTMTPKGLCASLKPNSFEDARASVLWPEGYTVSSQPWGLQLYDGGGRWVAQEGDYLYARGILTTRSALPVDDIRCGPRISRVFVLQRHGTPGTPLGADSKPAVVYDFGEVPRIRPRSLTLSGDGGLFLHRMHYDSWGRKGASGSAVAILHCYDPMGSDRVRVRFSYGKAVRSHGLLVLPGPRLDYTREPCTGR